MTAAALAFLGMLALLFVGVPIGLAMGLVGFLGFAILVGLDPARYLVGQIVFDNVMNYGFSVLPLFILMGNFVARSKLAEELFDAAHAFIGHLRGGLAMATIIAAGAFSAVCGSSLATTATMVNVALPAMRRRGYATSLAAASVAAGGTLGNLIPPGTVTVIYGLMTGTDIGKLFAAGIIPGIIAVFCLMGAIVWSTWRNPTLGPAGPRTGWRGRFKALQHVWGIVVLFVFVMGGIYIGAFTAMEAAGMGAAGAFLFAVGRRMLSLSRLLAILIETARTTAAMFVILFGALLFSAFIEAAGLPRALSQWLESLNVAPILVVALIVAIYIVLGTALEGVSMVLLTVPIFFPIVKGLGYDPVWFGILVVVVAEISLITPPVGLNYSIITTMVPDVATRDVVRGLYPFIAAEVVLVAILVAFPDVVLVLPSFMR